MTSLQIYDEDEISMRLRSRDNTIRFLMPLAHVICDSNKARAMIGFLSTDDFQPGITPIPDNWFMTADFGDDTARHAGTVIRHDAADSCVEICMTCDGMPFQNNDPLMRNRGPPWS